LGSCSNICISVAGLLLLLITNNDEEDGEKKLAVIGSNVVHVECSALASIFARHCKQAKALLLTLTGLIYLPPAPPNDADPPPSPSLDSLSEEYRILVPLAVKLVGGGNSVLLLGNEGGGGRGCLLLILIVTPLLLCTRP